jgi:hypothetical protein
MPSLIYSRLKAIARRPLQSEAMGLCHEAACKPSLWSERLRKGQPTSQAPKMVLKLRVLCPAAPGSPLDPRYFFGFSLTVSDAG